MGDWWIDETPYAGPPEEWHWAEKFFYAIQDEVNALGGITRSHVIVDDYGNWRNVADVSWSSGSSTPMQDLQDYIQSYTNIGVRVDAGGLHLGDNWFLTSALQRETKQVRDAIHAIATEVVEHQKRVPDSERINNTGPRPKQAFKRGRKQY